MLEVEHPADMAMYVGQELGPGEWLEINQKMIDLFAEATGDHQWIHCDVERASREMPDGRTIAHGYLTLSLVPRLSKSVYRIKNRSRGINYGSNKVRFTTSVPSGSRVRLRQTVRAVEAVTGGARITLLSTVEVEGRTRPALIAETITQAMD